MKSLSSRRGAKDDATTARKFSQLMMEGRDRAALQFLTNETRSGLLSLEDIINDGSGRTVKDVLEDKHPDPEPAHADAILNERIANVDFHPVLFNNITAEVIQNSALHTEGAAGPSGVNALSWRRLCTAFGQKSNDLCSALAAVARRICTSYVDPSCLMAHTSCRPYSFGQMPWCKTDRDGRGSSQDYRKSCHKSSQARSSGCCWFHSTVCRARCGVRGGRSCHGMHFAEDDTEAMILVDATDAFNRLNGQVTLVNCEVICPAPAPILINTYRDNSWLFVDGQCMLSKEGTTQGHPLAMAMYTIGSQPLIRRLGSIAKQVWYADDSAAGSSLERLRRWWDLLKKIGPLYGYFPNGAKTHILAKPEHTEAAKEIFKGTGITVSSEGKRCLGGAMGTASFLRQYVERKVNGWVKEIEKLSKFARIQPHAAYMLLTLMAFPQGGTTFCESQTGKHFLLLNFFNHLKLQSSLFSSQHSQDSPLLAS